MQALSDSVHVLINNNYYVNTISEHIEHIA